MINSLLIDPGWHHCLLDKKKERETASGLAEGEVDNAPTQATAFAAGTSAPEPTFRFRAATAPALIVAALASGATYSSEASAFASCSPASAPGSPTSGHLSGQPRPLHQPPPHEPLQPHDRPQLQQLGRSLSTLQLHPPLEVREAHRAALLPLAQLLGLGR